MQEQYSDLARKYREEMMQLYGRRRAAENTAEAAAVPASAAVMPAETQPTGEAGEANENRAPDAAESRPAPEPSAEEANETQAEADDNEEANENSAADAGFTETEYEEPELPSYIRPMAPAFPEEWQAQQEYEQRNTAEGMLRVVAATADSAYPVPGARVAVYTQIGNKRHLNYLLTTDESGETPTVTLPAPPASLSQEAKNLVPYALCDIEIFADGFFRSQALDVHIFAGITTRQVFQLVPLPLNTVGDDGITQSSAGRSGTD